jgi:hypothetical protein
MIIEIIHGWNAGGVAEAGEAVVEVEQVGDVGVVDILPMPRGTAKLDASRVEFGSGVAPMGIEKVHAGGELADFIEYVIALEAGSAVDIGAQVR